DGLVHVSQLADRFVNDPNTIVSVGQKVKVRVVSVDLDRNRIALTMRKEPQAAGTVPRVLGGRPPQREATKGPPPAPPKVHKSGDVAPNGMRFK
ncbi:MAG TPA: S1 RNA-binding domain-containing protein, partial [Rhizomicrobium sp.]|nr:S1 RNA-binding domain-containing protein [Rhizomicrobium sp.]